MHPIHKSVIDDINKALQLESSIRNTTSKLWRLNGQYFQTMKSISQSLIKFKDFLEKEK